MKTIFLNFFPLLIFISCVNIDRNGGYRETERFILPEKYSGKIIIIFNVPKGSDKLYDGKTRVYAIPKDGVLLTKFDSNDGYSDSTMGYQEFYRVCGRDTVSVGFIPNDQDITQLNKDSIFVYFQTIGGYGKWKYHDFYIDTVKNYLRYDERKFMGGIDEWEGFNKKYNLE